MTPVFERQQPQPPVHRRPIRSLALLPLLIQVVTASPAATLTLAPQAAQATAERPPCCAGRAWSPTPAQATPPGPIPAPLGVGSAPRICIDPGHGGVDPGALGLGHQEKDIVLDVGLRLAWLLEADTADPTGGGQWEVLLTRNDDTYVSLYERVALANAWPADSFVSIHANAYDSPAATGIETYSFQEGTHSADLRDGIQARMTDDWPLVDRGSKTANWYVLRETWMPATLTELAFITSPVDIQWLSSWDERQRAAEAHLFALQAHHGFGVHLPHPPPTTRCTAKTNSLGCLPAAGWTGSPTLTGPDDFRLTAELILSRQPGILFFGSGAAEIPFAGGTLCVAPPLVRLAPSTSGGSPPPACDGAFDAFFSQALMTSRDLATGTTLHAQFWYRDPFHADGSGVGMTDAVEFTISP